MTYLDITQRAELGIDGNCGFALLGPNIQEGEAEFVEIPKVMPVKAEWPYYEETMARERGAKMWAMREALLRLRKRLNAPNMSYFMGESHPLYLP
jgi:hypothetical protein